MLMAVSTSIIYVSLLLLPLSSSGVSAEAIIRSQLDVTLSLAFHPLAASSALSRNISAFYYRHDPSFALPSPSQYWAAPDPLGALVTSPLPPDLLRLADVAAANVEGLFWVTTQLCMPCAVRNEGAEEQSVESPCPLATRATINGTGGRW
jgi:hypothetical protein